MRKPPSGSPLTLSSIDLMEAIQARNEWMYQELLSELLPKYTAYDREGLGHRIRQVLSDQTKKGTLQRIGKGKYVVLKGRRANFPSF